MFFMKNEKLNNNLLLLDPEGITGPRALPSNYRLDTSTRLCIVRLPDGKYISIVAELVYRPYDAREATIKPEGVDDPLSIMGRYSVPSEGLPVNIKLN